MSWITNTPGTEASTAKTDFGITDLNGTLRERTSLLPSVLPNISLNRPSRLTHAQTVPPLTTNLFPKVTAEISLVLIGAFSHSWHRSLVKLSLASYSS